MNHLVINENNWTRKSEKMKLMFVHLTDADLHYDIGKKSEMMTKLRTRLCMTKEELHYLLLEL